MQHRVGRDVHATCGVDHEPCDDLAFDSGRPQHLGIGWPCCPWMGRHGPFRPTLEERCFGAGVTPVAPFAPSARPPAFPMPETSSRFVGGDFELIGGNDVGGNDAEKSIGGNAKRRGAGNRDLHRPDHAGANQHRAHLAPYVRVRMAPDAVNV